MTIIDFLLARIAEDEAGPGSERSAYPGESGPVTVTHDGRVVDEHGEGITDRYSAWLERQPLTDRARRVLAECRAKRVIVEDVACGHFDRDYNEAVKHLAAVYADHPDYDPEWRP